MENFLAGVKLIKNHGIEIPELTYDNLGAGNTSMTGKSVLSTLRIRPRTKTRKGLTSQKMTSIVAYTILSWDSIWKFINNGAPLEDSSMGDLLNYVNSRQSYSFLTNVSDLSDVSVRAHKDDTAEKPLVKPENMTFVVILDIKTDGLHWIDPTPVTETEVDFTELTDKKTVMSKYLGNKLWLLDTYNMTNAKLIDVYHLVKNNKLVKIVPDTWKTLMTKKSESVELNMKNLQAIHKELAPKLTKLAVPANLKS
ncbi:DNA-binding virion core protein VP8/L4R [Salmon gill poxvirus]|nr:DNA-binding virion core protein VP8/L4R [Salmon gill poxvirus]